MTPAPAPPPQRKTGSWWALHDILREADDEFGQWKDIVESGGGLSCPRDGEPLQTAPDGPSDAGSGVAKYCPFCGWRAPRDVIAPRRGVMMGRDG